MDHGEFSSITARVLETTGPQLTIVFPSFFHELKTLIESINCQKGRVLKAKATFLNVPTNCPNIQLINDVKQRKEAILN